MLPDLDDDLLAVFRAVGRGTAARDSELLAAVLGEDPLAAPAGGRVLIAGDWHGNTPAALAAVKHAARLGVRTVLQLGDFGFWGDAGSGEGYLDVLSTVLIASQVTLLVIDGNHEDFPFLESHPLVTAGPAAGLRPVRPRLWHLPRGTRWTWPGPDGEPVRWLAAGGAVSVDAALRVPGRSWWPQEELTDEQVDQISAAGPTDVLLCHDRPQAAGLALGDEPGLWWYRMPQSWARDDLRRSDSHSSRLQRLIDDTQPGQVWHGHLHQRTDVTVDPASWGGVCQIHGLADDGSSLGRNTCLAGTDGAIRRPA